MISALRFVRILPSPARQLTHPSLTRSPPQLHHFTPPPAMAVIRYLRPRQARNAGPLAVKGPSQAEMVCQFN